MTRVRNRCSKTRSQLLVYLSQNNGQNNSREKPFATSPPPVRSIPDSILNSADGHEANGRGAILQPVQLKSVLLGNATRYPQKRAL